MHQLLHKLFLGHPLKTRFPKSGKILFEEVKNPWTHKRNLTTINNLKRCDNVNVPYAGGANSLFFQDISFNKLKQALEKSKQDSKILRNKLSSS